MTNIEAKKIENHCKQTGVVRTNCVDCLGKNTKKGDFWLVNSDYITANLFLDRTNTAQFVIAKVALGHQLHALGYLANPHVEYDTGLFAFLKEIIQFHEFYG